MFYYNLSHRISWSGIIAGLLVGIVSFMGFIALGVTLTSIIGLDLSGSTIVGVIWSLLAVYASSYIAGMVSMFACKGNFTEDITLNTRREDARFIGLLTGCLIILGTTYLTFSGLNAVITGVGKVVQGVGSVAGETIKTTATMAADTTNISKVRSLISDVDQTDIEKFVADNVDGLDQAQVRATSTIVRQMLANTKSQLDNQNISSNDTGPRNTMG